MIFKARLYGGTGNQMFQIAATIGAAKKACSQYVIPRDTVNPSVWPSRFSHLFPKNEHTNDWHWKTWKEPSHAYHETPDGIKLIYKGYIMDGYFQSWKYFHQFRDYILKVFKAPEFIGKNGIVSIHKRMGDYTLYPTKHPIVPEYYIAKAILFFVQKGYNNFIVFSDEIDRCKKDINSDRFVDCNFIYSCSREPLDDLYLMASCEHNIISNSTFSWWGAYLNRNPDKIVVTPDESNWFGPDNAHLNVDDLLLPEWHRIKY